MYNKRFTNLILVLTLVLLAGGLVFMITRQANAEGDGANRTDTAVAAVGTAFTYQGSLEKNGSAVNDTCNMVFRLRDSNGSQVGTNTYINSVTVSNGVFSEELDFGNTAFTGDERFLEIGVECSGDSGFTTLTPNVALNAAPYALSLRPGAVISGSLSSGKVLNITNSATGVGTAAVHGIAGGESWAGTPNKEVGVLGESHDGYGVVGQSSANPGVFGYSRSDWGVYGYSTESVGVYGWSGDNNSYGVYSAGNAHIEGNLTWKATTSYVSIAAAAFQPTSNTYVYSNSGNELYSSDASSVYYVAPVELPHGATITDISFYWSDTTVSGDGNVALWRTTLDGSESVVGTALTSGSTGSGSSSAPTITNAVIDNSQYSYYLYLALPTPINLAVHGVTIAYTTTQPH